MPGPHLIYECPLHDLWGACGAQGTSPTNPSRGAGPRRRIAEGALTLCLLNRKACGACTNAGPSLCPRVRRGCPCSLRRWLGEVMHRRGRRRARRVCGPHYPCPPDPPFPEGAHAHPCVSLWDGAHSPSPSLPPHLASAPDDTGGAYSVLCTRCAQSLSRTTHMGTPTTFLCPEIPKCCHNEMKKAEKDAVRWMQTAMEKVCNLGLINRPFEGQGDGGKQGYRCAPGHNPVGESGP